MNEKAFIEWSYVDHWVGSIVNEIEKRELKFDTIVALSRGGLIPGAIISYKLGIKNLQTLGINTREEDGKDIETNFYQVPNHLSGNVLIIDDINDSGKTFEAVNSLIKSEYPDICELLYCSLVKRYTSTFNKDTIEAIQTKLDDWFVFPWDK